MINDDDDDDGGDVPRETSSKFETYPQSLVLYHISVKCLDDVSGKLGVLKVG